MFQIAIDTDTMPVSPAVYADEYRGRALPTVLPLVQGFRGNLRVYFLGEHAPSENAAVALYLRALQSKEKLVQTGLGTRGISDAGNVYYDVPLAADTTALSAVLGNRENVIMRAGIVANDVTASPQTNFEWQLNIAVSASAVGTGEKPPVSPNAIEEHNNDVSAHPFILQKIAAAEVDVSGLRTSIAGVSESLNATNTNLNNAKSELSTEISEVSAALDAETIARENEDAAIRAALESETNERKDAVSSISENVAAVYSELNASDAAIRAALESETTARSEAIEEERNELVNTATHLQNAINSERVQMLQNDAKLSSRIITEANCRIAEDSEIRAALAAETTARKSEDASIRAALETERSERLLQDVIISEALTSERSERIKRDSELSSETSCLAAADSEIKGKINSEKTCRTAADNALRGSINTLNSDVAAIEGDIQNLENRVVSTGDTITEHINNTNPHWVLDCVNNVLEKTNGENSEGILIAYDNSCSYRGIYIQSACGCFSPRGDLIKFGNNGCVSLSGSGISLWGTELSLSFSENILLSSGSEISLSGGTALSLSADYISLWGTELSLSFSENILLSSGSEISLSGGTALSLSADDISLESTGVGNISILSCGISVSLGSGKGFFFNGFYGGYIAFEEREGGGFGLIQKNYRCKASDRYLFDIDNFDAVQFSTKNYNDEIGNYAFCATAVSLCRSGGNVLQGNSSQTALYFGTTAFATSKIDSGARVVCFGNPLGKVNIKAGNGGRIDICATCVYVNGVKIST